MRLWTFQSVEVMDDILHSDTWFSDISKSKHAWPDDKKLMPHDELYAPIYCFGSGYEGTPLSLLAFKELWRSFNTWYDFNLDTGERFMLELELPESEVLGARVSGKSDGVMWDYVYSNFKDFIRHENDTAEVVIPWIRKEWIVCYRKFYMSETDYDHMVCDTMETIVLRDNAFPLWTGMVDLAFDGTLFDSIRTQDDWKKELVTDETGEYKSEKMLILRHGMDGCPRYFTINEAIACCNGQTLLRISKRLEELGMTSYKPETTIMDLFPDGLLPAGVK